MNAPNQKIVTVDAKNPKPENWKDFIPETENVLSISTGSGFIFANYMKDAVSQVKQYDYEGKMLREIKLPGIGSAGGFGGKKEDLLQARSVNEIPILRKDFMIDEYQILEAKAWGADIILLIAAILTPAQIAAYGKLAQSLGLNVLLEVHDLTELERSICPHLDAIGVNNRNLGDFTVNIQTSFDLVDKIPNEFLKISESAIDNPQVIKELKSAGYNGFLIGENFMKTHDPGQAIRDFVAQL